jgi:hypothetical protein
MAETLDSKETKTTEKKTVSRRRFLKTAAAGAAVAGVVAAAPNLLTAEVPNLFGGAPRAAGEPIVAYVADAATGEIVLLAGEREVRVRDLGMVSWLVGAISGM